MTTHAFGEGVVFESPDLGRTWQEIGNPRWRARPTQVVAHPDRVGTLFVGTSYQGVFHSADGGLGWRRVNRGLGRMFRDVWKLRLVDPSNQLLVAVVGDLDEMDDLRLFRSTGERTRWTDISPGFGVRDFAFHSASPRILLASTETGVFRSRNRGRTWRGPTPGSEGLVFWHLSFAPSDPRTVYGTTRSELYRSTDGGRSWRRVGESPGVSWFISLDVDPKRPSTLVAGLLDFDSGAPGIARSRDGGETWTSAGLQGERAWTLHRSRHQPRTLYAGTDTAIFRRKGRRGRWKLLDAGLDTARIGHMAVAAPVAGLADEPVVYAVSGRALFRLLEAGGPWQRVPVPGGGPLLVYLSPADPRVIYTGIGNEIAISADGGRTWTRVQLGNDETDLSHLEIDSGDPSRVYAATFGGGLGISDDGGLTWSFRTDTDLGRDLSEVRVDPNAPDRVYAVGQGVIRSTDRGLTWGPTTLSGWSIAWLSIDPRRPRTLFVGCRSSGEACVFRSRDGGQTWSRTDPGLQDEPGRFLFDPVRAGTVYAAAGGALFRSTDRGSTWQPFGRGLESRFVNVLRLSDSRLWAGTTTRGVHRLELEAPVIHRAAGFRAGN